MKLFKYLVSSGIVAVVLLTSCGKKVNNDYTPYNKYMTGVMLTAIDGTPVGTVGQPDNKIHADSFFHMGLYPTPSVNMLSAGVVINNTEPLTVTVKLVSAIYENAPGNAIIENKEQAGLVVLSQSRDLQPAPPPAGGIGGVYPGQTQTFQFDVSTLPRGFYRVYVETSTGETFWDNAWLMR